MCKQCSYVWSSIYDNRLPVLNAYLKSLDKLILFLNSTTRNNYYRSDGWELEHLEVLGNECSNEDYSESIIYCLKYCLACVYENTALDGWLKITSFAAYCINPLHPVLVPLMLYYSYLSAAVLYVLNKASFDWLWGLLLLTYLIHRHSYWKKTVVTKWTVF